MESVIDTKKPVMEFFEDGEFLKIVVPSQNTRYLKKTIAQAILRAIGEHATEERTTLYVKC
jgi:hypothetical protein